MKQTPRQGCVTLPIHGIGSSGEGVGRSDGFTIFVDGALPGELVEAKTTKLSRNYGVAKLLSIVKPSPDRVKPLCPLFGKCGGCQLMHLSYEKQLEIKRQKVVDALSRIGKIDDCNIFPCEPSPLPLGYRNKIQLPVKNGADGLKIGLYAKSSHDLIPIDRCLIHCDLGESVFQKIKEAILQYDPKILGNTLRHILIKSAIHTGEVLVILVTNRGTIPSSLASKIKASHPSIRGVVRNIHETLENVILGETFEVLEGDGFIREKLCDLKFKISPASFFQVNPMQAEKIYLKALELADLNLEETVLDAYCGVGTLSLIFAKHAKKVIGVESVAAAIEDARHNGELNNLQNASFTCAPAETFIGAQKGIDVLLLNPPRKGCDIALIESVKKILPRKIVYISCDPATLARDLARLNEIGYRVDIVCPYDMFPQTAHVECVARLCLG